MASRIAGITVEIGGDTTKLQTALKGLNGEIKNTQSQLKDVENRARIHLAVGLPLKWVQSQREDFERTDVFYFLLFFNYLSIVFTAK